MHVAGLCVFAKRLEQGRFVAPWERGDAGELRLTVSELTLLLEGSELVGRMPLARLRSLSRHPECRWVMGLPTAIPCRRVLNLDSEKDPQILRQAAKLLVRENERLTDKVVALTSENLALKGASPADLQLRLAQLDPPSTPKIFAWSASGSCATSAKATSRCGRSLTLRRRSNPGYTGRGEDLRQIWRVGCARPRAALKLAAPPQVSSSALWVQSSASPVCRSSAFRVRCFSRMSAVMRRLTRVR
jgi:hypothetical protein